MNEMQLSRGRSVLVTGLVALAIGLVLLLSVRAGSAQAGENKFCWGSVIKAYPLGCTDPTARLLTGVYASADNGNVCAWSTVPETPYLCTKSKGTEGVYNNVNLNGTQLGQAQVLHFNTGKTNKVYGFAYWK